MRATTTRHQLFGDLNRQLGNRRRQMNANIREEILERIQKNRQAEEDLDSTLFEISKKCDKFINGDTTSQ